MGYNHHRLQIAKLGLTSRVFTLLAMSLSCALLPDWNPGDDVLQFDLRLQWQRPRVVMDRDYGDDLCFCLRGHACDTYKIGDTSSAKRDHPFFPNFAWYEYSRRRKNDYNPVNHSFLCADDDIYNASRRKNYKARFIWLDRFYEFILPPVTKSDGARFLKLSVDPWAR